MFSALDRFLHPVLFFKQEKLFFISSTLAFELFPKQMAGTNDVVLHDAIYLYYLELPQ